MSKRKGDKEVTALRAQIETLKSELSELKKVERGNLGKNNEGLRYSTLDYSKKIQPGFLPSLQNHSTVNYDLSFIKKDFRKVLFLSLIAFGVIVSLKFLLPHLPLFH
ncbi:hypothetical protein COS81_03965 [candidate division WWE3 bacterium CG06_land_8_20_14_3_00_42_16]|uniref:Uncharacterized protein n=3 Tax=Katanobacteria TaxID=422282 RepID=A0A2M7AME9_UNCKA|nr:MAG: hypothetical protein COS81_03965 [candidate division WWE3 bacterium CG06_land_8_20_14_3_00_42_16]PIZ43409.1 MAG: hypothetical protein COY34_00960 [candidate division WWE3 bacterium CG_4_10_14_0_2_um_filter_42_8]PJC68604.1 MAG: hypothetical protein CO015_03425 [candidate division WWE3 bacterium CG_4_8_14_3_um_filter_42_11]